MRPTSVSPLIVSRIIEGLLPSLHRPAVWAGHGTGRLCDGCAAAIDATEIETEIDLPDAAVLRLHELCFRTWRDELQRIVSSTASA